MGEQHALRNGQHHLMEMEKHENQAEAADGMFGVDSRADGRSDISDERFRDAVHADGIVVAERVLHDSDGRAEKHPGDRIAAAHAEINRDQQRQINQFRPAAVLVKECLEDEREKTNERNGAAIILVYFDI